MNFPNNIKKAHIIKAIERIDNGDIPENSTSKYYDLEYNSKLYSPKLVVSFANFFINGVDLDRNSFDGGPGKPAFKLLEKEGFRIIEKVKIPKVRLYDFHGESALKNAERLLSADKGWFYWDDGNFKKYIKGDIVFWVNRNTRKAFFTIVDETNIKPVFEEGKIISEKMGLKYMPMLKTQIVMKTSFDLKYFKLKRFQLIGITLILKFSNFK
jgi:hypothetical protein